MPKDAEGARAAIERFLQSSRQPVLIDPGEPQFAITPENFHLEARDGRVTVQIWDRDRTLFRKVIGLVRERTGQLDIEIERFGKQSGMMQFVDLAKPQSLNAT